MTAPTDAVSFEPRLRQAAAELSGPLSPEDGLPESAIVAAEERLGIRLPGVLRTFYLLAGNRQDMTCWVEGYSGSRIDFLRPDELKLEGVQTFSNSKTKRSVLKGAQQWMVFTRDEYGGNLWYVAVEDLILEDPPLSFDADLDPPVRLHQTRLSDYLIELAYYQASSGGLPFAALMDVETHPDILQKIRTTWIQIPLKRVSPALYFVRDGAIISAYDHYLFGLRLTIAARTQNLLLDLHKELEVEFPGYFWPLELNTQYMEDQAEYEKECEASGDTEPFRLWPSRS